MIAKRLRCLGHNYFTVKCIKGITNLGAGASSRRPVSMPTGAATALASDDTSIPLRLHSHVLDTHVVAILVEINASRHAKYYSVEEVPLWFQTIR